MAVVNIELSEYDALRESLKDYKERVAKLDNELSGLKKGENVVVTTKHCVRKVENIRKLIENSLESLKNISLHSRYYYDFHDFNAACKAATFLNDPDISNCITRAIYNAFTNGDSFCGMGDFEIIESSTEVQGYNDLRLVIENKLKEEAKAEIDSLKQSYINKKEEYEKRSAEIKAKIKGEYETAIKQFENTIEDREKTIVDLQTKLSEKTASLNDTDKKLVESIRYKNDYFNMKVQNERLTEELETLTKELEKYKKPSLLNKIFNW